MRRGWISQDTNNVMQCSWLDEPRTIAQYIGYLARKPRPSKKRSYDRVNISIQQYRALNYGYTSCKCPHALETWAILSRCWLFFKNVFLEWTGLFGGVSGFGDPSYREIVSPHNSGINHACLAELSGCDVREVPITEFV